MPAHAGRFRLAILAAGIVAAGLLVRFAPIFPGWLQDAGGGILYVCLLAVLVQFVSPELRAGHAAGAALLITALVEFSQLSRFRGTGARPSLLVRLVFGATFSWWDFPPYFAGAGLAVWLLRPTRPRLPSPPETRRMAP